MDLEEYVKESYRENRRRIVAMGLYDEYLRVMRIVMVKDDRPGQYSIYIYPVTDPDSKLHPVTLREIES